MSDTGNPGEGTAPETAAGTTQPEAPQQPAAFTPEQQAVLNRLLAKERKAAGEAALADYKTAQEAEQAKARGEWEKVALTEKARAEAAEAKARATQAKSAVLSAAVKAQVHDLEAAFLLVRDAITYDAEGNPSNVEELMTALVKDRPYLVNAAAPNGSGASPGNPAGGRGTAITPESLKNMSPQEINKLPWADVQKALAAQK